MSGTWLRVPFDDALVDVSRLAPIRLRSDAYLTSGSIPVIDQGAKPIAGYWNRLEDAVTVTTPLIIFGDHTKALKLVDYDFCVGAEGVKILKPTPGFDARFVFHFLRTLSLPEVGYSRHFKFLQRVTLPKPPLAEQRRIAAILDQADDLRRNRRVALEKLNALPEAIFQGMFGDPIANPKAWPVYPLIDLVDRERPITYGILMPGPPLDQGVPYIRVVDMKNGGVHLASVRMTSQDISDAYRRSLLRTDDLLLSIRGHVGRLASVPASLSGANITQDTARLALTGAHPLFVRECLRTAALQKWMKRHTKGGAVKGINLGDVKHIPVIAPPQEMQEKFAAAVRAYEAIYINQSDSAGSLEILFASLQHRAFSGNLTSLSVEAMLAPV